MKISLAFMIQSLLLNVLMYSKKSTHSIKRLEDFCKGTTIFQALYVDHQFSWIFPHLMKMPSGRKESTKAKTNDLIVR